MYAFTYINMQEDAESSDGKQEFCVIVFLYLYRNIWDYSGMLPDQFQRCAAEDGLRTHCSYYSRNQKCEHSQKAALVSHPNSFATAGYEAMSRAGLEQELLGCVSEHPRFQEAGGGG